MKRKRIRELALQFLAPEVSNLIVKSQIWAEAVRDEDDPERVDAAEMYLLDAVDKV